MNILIYAIVVSPNKLSLVPLPYSDVEYVERKWSPLSKAIERGLKIVVKIIRKVIDGGSEANDLSFLSISEPQQSISRGNSPEHDMARRSQHDSRVVYDQDSRDGGSSSRDRDYEDRRERRDREYRRYKSAGQTRKKTKGHSGGVRHKNSRDRDDFVHHRERDVTSAPPVRNIAAESSQQHDADRNEVGLSKSLSPEVKPMVNYALSHNVDLLQNQMNRMQMRQHELNAEYQTRIMTGVQMDSHILRSSAPNAPLSASHFTAVDPHNQSSRFHSQSIENIGGLGRPPPISAQVYREQENLGQVIDDIYAGVGAPRAQIGDGLSTRSVGSVSTGTAKGSHRPGGKTAVAPGSTPDSAIAPSNPNLHELSDDHSHMRQYVDDDPLDLGPGVTIVSDNDETPRSWGHGEKHIPGDDEYDYDV